MYTDSRPSLRHSIQNRIKMNKNHKSYFVESLWKLLVALFWECNIHTKGEFIYGFYLFGFINIRLCVFDFCVCGYIMRNREREVFFHFSITKKGISYNPSKVWFNRRKKEEEFNVQNGSWNVCRLHTTHNTLYYESWQFILRITSLTLQ